MIRWIFRRRPRPLAHLDRLRSAERETRPILERVDDVEARMDRVEERLRVIRREEDAGRAT